jgi:hypothetical protein
MPTSPVEDKERMLARAKLFAELARRTESPFDALPASDVSPALLVLWKEATFWALSALGDDSPRDRDLEGILTAAPREAVIRAAGGTEGVPNVERALRLDARDLASDASRGQAPITVLASFARDLIVQLETPRREARKGYVRRWARRGLLALSVVAAVAGVLLARRYFAPNLLRGAKRTLSSERTSCQTVGECGNALFHTQEDDEPWVMYDLGHEVDLHSIDVQNRTDCCYERAVPLVVETSSNGEAWNEQARTERAFATWSAGLAGRARFIRLRADRRTYLHLGAVIVR